MAASKLPKLAAEALLTGDELDQRNRVLVKLMLRVDSFLDQSGDPRRELGNATAIHITPEIAVEVISLSETTVRMIQRRLKRYFEAGVKEVWLVYPEAREAEIWTELSPPETALSGKATLESPLLPGFALPLGDLFA